MYLIKLIYSPIMAIFLYQINYNQFHPLKAFWIFITYINYENHTFHALVYNVLFFKSTKALSAYSTITQSTKNFKICLQLTYRLPCHIEQVLEHVYDVKRFIVLVYRPWRKLIPGYHVKRKKKVYVSIYTIKWNIFLKPKNQSHKNIIQIGWTGAHSREILMHNTTLNISFNTFTKEWHICKYLSI